MENFSSSTETPNACYEQSESNEPTMTPSQDLMAELNNEGASQIENGQYSEAISVLVMAVNLAMSRGGAESCLPVDLEASDTGSVVSHGSHGRISHQHQAEKKAQSRARRKRRTAPDSSRHTSTSPSLVLTEDIAVPHRQPHFVHSKPIRVLDRFHPPSFGELTLYVVYNLALSYQLRALSQQRKKSNAWRRCVRWYTLAHVMQDRDATIGLTPTYTVALWNNMAQAYWQMGKDKKSDEYLQNMLTNLICMIDHECIREVDQVDDFIDNASHLLHPCTTVADAA